MRVLSLTLLFAAAAAAAGGTSAAGRGGTALLIVDIQNFYFEGGLVPLVGPERAAANARRLLDLFRARGWPVVHVQHLPEGQLRPAPEEGDVQYRIRDVVLPRPGEAVVGKHHANAFLDTDLLEQLRRAGVTSVVICGMQTHMCVEATARAAADLGFDVTVVGDACATRDLSFDGVDVPAAEVHASTLATLAGTYGEVIDTDGVLAALGGPDGGGSGAEAERRVAPQPRR